MGQLPLVRPAAEQPSLDYRSYPSRLRVHELMSTVTENRVDSSIKPFFDALEITLFRALEHFHVYQNRKGRHRGNFEPTSLTPHMLIKGLSDNGYDSNKTGQVVFFHRMPHLPQGDSNRRGSFTRAGKDIEGTARESDVSSLSIDSHISALASRTWPGT
jgi:hypothetical protein